MKKINILRAIIGGITACFAIALSPLPALAHQSPGGCNANRLNLSIVKDKTAVMIGDTITYTVTISNVNFNSDIACDITSATVSVTLPAPDGTPTGAIVTLASGVNYPAGTAVSIAGTAQYVVATNPGVTDMVAEARVSGTLHDAPVDHSALIVKTLGTTIIETPDVPDTGSPSTPSETPPESASYPRALPRTGR